MKYEVTLRDAGVLEIDASSFDVRDGALVFFHSQGLGKAGVARRIIRSFAPGVWLEIKEIS